MRLVRVPGRLRRQGAGKIGSCSEQIVSKAKWQREKFAREAAGLPRFASKEKRRDESKRRDVPGVLFV